MGAADPTSGTVSLHEIVRGYGALLRTGWKPLRTILFASWDAEEVRLFCITKSYNSTSTSVVWSYRQHRMGRRLRKVDPEACRSLP